MRLGESKQPVKGQGQVKRLQFNPSLIPCPPASPCTWSRGQHWGHCVELLTPTSLEVPESEMEIKTFSVSDLQHYLLPTWEPRSLPVSYAQFINTKSSNPVSLSFSWALAVFFTLQDHIFLFNQMHYVVSDYLLSFWRLWAVFGDLVFNMPPYTWFLLQNHRKRWCYKGQDHLFTQVELIPNLFLSVLGRKMRYTEENAESPCVCLSNNLSEVNVQGTEILFDRHDCFFLFVSLNITCRISQV